MESDESQFFLARVTTALKSQGMSTERSVSLGGVAVADVAGFRCRFSWAGIVLVDECLVVRTVASATESDLRALYRDGFAYARSRNRVPLLRGMQFGYFVVPCLVTEHASSELTRVAEARPPKHWAVHEAPVVVDLGSKTAHYYKDTAIWGAFYFRYIQRLIEQVVCQAVTSA